jgi:DNA-binding NtrC family response regulator
MATPEILLVEDEAGLGLTLQRVLGSEGYQVTLETRGDKGLALAKEKGFAVVLTDLRLPGISGLELTRQLHQVKPRLPIIVMTAHGTTETAIEATKFGAFDYVMKPFEMPELLDLLGKAVASSRLMSESVALGEPESGRDALVGKSRAMQVVYKEIGRIAPRPVNVLIRGETGTGKELIARAIYQHSDRAQAPFVAVNCSAIPETLLESELFGHERGAFTGAEARRIGRFEQADHGTIFLDEIGDMTPNTQAKLLRVLQEKTLHRLGGKEAIPIDVRVLAATHWDLEKAMEEKQFREDLFYRLSVVVLKLPPLRERREDIPDIVNYFLKKYGPELGAPEASIESAAVEFLQAQAWPGNVRELENAARKLLLVSQGFTISLEHAKAVLAPTAAHGASSEQSLRECAQALLATAQRGESGEALEQLLGIAEKEIFSQAIELAGGNQAKAARWLGVSRLTMREKLIHFGIHPNQANLGPEEW